MKEWLTRVALFALVTLSCTALNRLALEWVFRAVRRNGGEIPDFFEDNAWWIALFLGGTLAAMIV